MAFVSLHGVGWKDVVSLADAYHSRSINCYLDRVQTG